MLYTNALSALRTLKFNLFNLVVIYLKSTGDHRILEISVNCSCEIRECFLLSFLLSKQENTIIGKRT